MQNIQEKYPKLYAKAKKKYGDDPLYMNVLKAKSKAEMKRAMDTLAKIRGSMALNNLKRMMKTASNPQPVSTDYRMAQELVRVAKLLATRNTGEPIFAPDDVDRLVRELEAGIDAPFVRVKKATLGTTTLMMVVSLDPKSEWENNILENSRYFRMSLDADGTLEQFVVAYDVGKKFRKRRVKSVSDAVKKINQYIKQVS